MTDTPEDKMPPLDSNQAPKPLADRMLNGTMWMFGMSWLIRLLSIFSISILARLLDTEDFGLIAITSAIVALPIVLLDLGLEAAIIKDKNPSRGLYNTAWTIKIIQMSCVAVCLAASAPWIAGFYDDPRITHILYALCIMIALRGFENLWVVSFRKTLNFRRDFAYETACKLLAVFITIGLAWHYRSYWALVYGQIAVALVRLSLSMLIAPERPRFSLSHTKELWSFSQWSMVKGLAFYVLLQSDKLILGRLSSVENVGAYSLGREIAELPMRDISGPANRALGSGFSELQDHIVRLVNALVKSVNAISSITFPIAIGLTCTAAQTVPIMLGEGWSATVPILQILAFSSIFTASTGILSNALPMIGYIRDVAILTWVRALCLLVFAIPATMAEGPIGTAFAVLASEILNTVFTLICYRYRIPALKKRKLLAAIMRPAVSAGIMAFSLFLMDQSDFTQNIYILLGAKISVGVVIYLGSLYSLWWLSGCPDSIETIVINKIRPYINRLYSH